MRGTSFEAQRRADSQKLDELNRQQIAMTREQRIQKVADLTKFVKDLQDFAGRSGSPLNERQERSLKHAQDTIASIKLGLQTESEGGANE